MSVRTATLSLIVLALVGFAPAADAQPVKPTAHVETAHVMIEGSVRAVARGSVAAQQRQKIQAHWKRLYQKADPDVLETEHFLLVGLAPGKTLKEVGAGLEKQLVLARKAVELEREEPWAGKLAVYLLPERGHYNSFVRGVEQRRPEEDELGTFDVQKDFPHVAATAGEGPLDPGVDGQAGEQAAAAVLTTRAGNAVLPEWLLHGFGRATVFQAAPAAALTAERRRAKALLAQKKRTVRDLTGGALKADEATVLRASLVEYLAYSGRISKFVPLVLGYRPTENVAEPTTDMAFNAANLNADKLNDVWQKWAKAFP